MPRCGTVDSTSRGPEAAGRRLPSVSLGGGAGRRRPVPQRTIHAGFFEKGNQTGDGACLLGNNFFERAAVRPDVRWDFGGWRRDGW